MEDIPVTFRPMRHAQYDREGNTPEWIGAHSLYEIKHREKQGWHVVLDRHADGPKVHAVELYHQGIEYNDKRQRRQRGDEILEDTF